MNILLRLDSFLVENVFQSCANFSERLLGVNCFGLARLCCLLCALGILCSLTMMGIPAMYAVIALLLVAIFLVATIGGVYLHEHDYEKSQVTGGSACMNPARKPSGSMVRIIVAGGLSVNGGLVVAVGWLFFSETASMSVLGASVMIAVAILFFAACETLPPRTVSKLQKLLVSLRGLRAAADSSEA